MLEAVPVESFPNNFSMPAICQTLNKKYNIVFMLLLFKAFKRKLQKNASTKHTTWHC
jgi:hypothetical protein